MGRLDGDPAPPLLFPAMCAVQRIELSIVEPLGAERRQWPVTMGVPFPQGALAEAEALRLERGGAALPLQTRTMLTWPDGSSRWVLLDFQLDLTPGGNRADLTWGEGADPRPQPPEPVRPRQTADGTLFLETGAHLWAIAPSGTVPFARAYLGEREVIADGGLQSWLRVDGESYELRLGPRPIVEEAGPLRVAVRGEGLALGADGTPGFDVTVRLYAHAGHGWLRVWLTLTNRMRRLAHLEEFSVSLAPRLDSADGAEADGAFLVSSADLGEHAVHVDGLVDGYRSLRVGLVDPTAPARWGDDPEPPRRAARPCQVRPGSGPAQVEPRPGASWCALVPAAAVLGDGQTTVSLQCRRFWHLAPKEIALTPRRVELALYPGWAPPLPWPRGVARTHELILDLAGGRPRRPERTAFALGFEKQPSFQVATRNWMVDSGAFGPVLRYEPARYRWWEYILRAAQTRQTSHVEADPTVGLSFLDYGRSRSPGCGDEGFGLLLQMARTGEVPAWERVEAIAQHQIDVDAVHDDELESRLGGQGGRESLDGPLFYGLLSGYRRAEEVALARAEGVLKAIDRGELRVKAPTRAAGYALLALARVWEHYRDERHLQGCEAILDWLEEWCAEDGHYTHDAYGPPGRVPVATSRSDGILACGLLRHHLATGRERSYRLLKELVDRDLDATGLIRPEGFCVQETSPLRNDYEPEPDFWFEPLLYLAHRTGEGRYADVGLAEMQRVFVERRMLAGAASSQPSHFFACWLPALARADELGILRDPRPF